MTHFKILLATLAFAASGLASAQQTLLNVSYDVAREFYKDVNAAFVPWYKKTTGAGLGARAAVGLVDLDVLARGLLVGRNEGGVDVLVELACDIVRDIQQRLLRRCNAAGRQRKAGNEKFEFVIAHDDAVHSFC